MSLPLEMLRSGHGQSGVDRWATGRRRREVITYFAIVVGTAIGLALLTQALDEVLSHTAKTLLAGGVMAVAVPAALLVVEHMRRRRTVAWRLNEQQCAVCHYSLVGIAAAADGCTVCPECGAAWRLIARCLACGRQLEENDRDVDGALVCPECGEAWRLQGEEPLRERSPPA